MESNTEYHGSGQPATQQQDRDAMRSALIGHQAQNALAFQTQAIKRFGPVAGVFLRQLLFWEGRGKCPDGFIYKSESEWYEETGLNRSNQRTARKRLKEARVLEEDLRQPWPGARLVMHYRLNLHKLIELMGAVLEPEDTQAESAWVPGQKGPGSRSPEENNRIIPLTGAAEAPTEETNKAKEGEAPTGSQGRVTPVKANRFVGAVATGLKDRHSVLLDDTQLSKMGKNFKRLLRSGASVENLDAAAKRIVEEWKRIQLTPGDALDDVHSDRSGEKVDPSPPEVIEAIRADDYFGEQGTMKEVRLWEVAQRWDFTSPEDPPMRIRKEISPDREECNRWLDRLRHTGRKAVKVQEGGEEAATGPPDKPVGVDQHEAGDAHREPPVKRPPAHLEDVRRVLQDPEGAPRRVAHRYREGRLEFKRVVEAVAVALEVGFEDALLYWDAVRHVLRESNDQGRTEE